MKTTRITMKLKNFLKINLSLNYIIIICCLMISSAAASKKYVKSIEKLTKKLDGRSKRKFAPLNYCETHFQHKEPEFQ